MPAPTPRPGALSFRSVFAHAWPTLPRFEIVNVTLQQAERAGSFDPFDRLIAAQALDLDLVVATLDPEIAKFGCKVL
jgi:PIN domain nuclease of toxin-antitoxin system